MKDLGSRKSDYPWLPYHEANKYREAARRRGVSHTARTSGFMKVYQACKYADRMKKKEVKGSAHTWRLKRYNFIRRFIGSYNRKRTLRVYLALLMWAYKPTHLPRGYKRVKTAGGYDFVPDR